MAILTQKTIIFKCYIDKLIKTLYNKIWSSVKTHDFPKSFCLVVSVVLALELGAIHLYASGDEAACGRVDLVAVEETEDMLCISVCLSLDGGICGIFANILYDTEHVRFVSVSAESDGGGDGEADAEACDGVISLIVDSSSNDLCGRIARLTFEKLDRCESLLFEIYVREAYFFSGDGLESVALSGGVTLAFVNARRSEPRLIGAELISSDEGLELFLRGASDIGGVAAGFLVTVTCKEEGKSGSFESVKAAQHSGEAPMEFSLKVALPDSGYACVAVCPLIYVGRKILRGDVTVYTLYNGNLLTVQGHIKQ